MEPNLSFLSFIDSTFIVIGEKQLVGLRTQKFISMISSKYTIILPLLFRTLLHFELMFRFNARLVFI